jgi:hypothetical protein
MIESVDRRYGLINRLPQPIAAVVQQFDGWFEHYKPRTLTKRSVTGRHASSENR